MQLRILILLIMKIKFNVTLLSLLLAFSVYGQSFVNTTIAGTQYTRSTRGAFNLKWYSNNGGTGSVKKVHFVLSGIGAGDSILFVSSGTSSTSDYYVSPIEASPSFINVTELPGSISDISKTGGSSNIQRGFLLSAGDTAFDAYVRHDRTTSNTNASPFDSPLDIVLYDNSTGTYLTGGSDRRVLYTQQTVASDVYVWVGSDSADYRVSTNWSPERSTPSSSDILIFDNFKEERLVLANNGTSQLNETINQIMITPNSKVVFVNKRRNLGSAAKSILKLASGSNLSGEEFTYYPADFYWDMTFTGENADLFLADGSSLRVAGDDTLEIKFESSSYLATSGTSWFYRLPELSARGYEGEGACLKLNTASNMTSVGYFGMNPTLNSSVLFSGSSYKYTLDLFGGSSAPADTLEQFGGEGEIYVDYGVELNLTTSSTNKVYLDGKLGVYGLINGKIASDLPSASTESAWNDWEPKLQILNNGLMNGSIGNNINLTGGVKWQMYNTGNRAWRTVGFPFDDMHVSQISRNIVITGTKNSTNKDSFYSFNSTCSHCGTSLYSWDQANESWSAFESGSTANKIPAGQGVLLFFRGLGKTGLGDASASATAGAMDFKGTPLVGTQTVNLSYNSSGNTLKGVNLVSNPYMCNIDWNEVYTNSNTSNVADKFYFFDPVGKTYNTYDNTGSSPSYNGTNTFKAGSAGAKRTIQQGAAFFVVATGASPKIEFKEEDKVTTKGAASAFREEVVFPCNRLTMEMRSSNNSIPYFDHATLEWDMSEKNASQEQDYMDMVKLFGGYYGIGTLDSKGEWYTIDRRPDLEESKTMSIPLKLATHEKSGSYEIKFETCPEQSTADIVLVDLETGKKKRVLNGETIGFDHSSSTKSLNQRFALELTKASLGNDDKILEQRITVYPNPMNEENKLFLAGDITTLQSVELISMDGQQLASWGARSIHGNGLELPNALSAGTYLVKINGVDTAETTKLIISK